MGIPDPIVANPDLGALAFEKRFNIVDLGWIGDPVLAHIDRNWSAAQEAWYRTDVAAPDVVEPDSAFSCIYRQWLDSPDFQAQYHWSRRPERRPARTPVNEH